MLRRVYLVNQRARSAFWVCFGFSSLLALRKSVVQLRLMCAGPGADALLPVDWATASAHVDVFNHV